MYDSGDLFGEEMKNNQSKYFCCSSPTVFFKDVQREVL